MEEFILSGLAPPLQASSHMQELHEIFLEKVSIKSTGELVQREEISGCKDELELITLLRQNFSWKDLPSEPGFQKCSGTSTTLREGGNSAYKKGEWGRALRGYNLALTFAPLESQEMGLAYANRSALLVQLKEFEEASKDIEAALKMNENLIPESVRSKLKERRAKCIDLKKNVKTERGNKSEEYFAKEYFSLRNQSEGIVGAESFVEIDYHPEKGRRLVARENVPAGRLIGIDKPFVNVLNHLLSWELRHCHFCSKLILAGVPCQLCTFVIYCDEKCRDASCKGSHKYEHLYLAHLQPLASVIRHRDLQALRIMGIVGPQELRKLFSEGLSSSTKVYKHSYETMYNLVSHGMQSSSLKEKVEDVFVAIYLTQLLKHTSDFFQEEEEEDFENFVSSLILHHLGNIKFNAISVSKLENNSGEEISVPFATAVYPLISLCNHSCDPNVVPVKKFKFLETALVTIKSIKKGEEFCITYKPLFTNMKTKERLEYLQDCYNFLCSCVPCSKNWSIKSLQPPDSLFQLKKNCQNCSINSPCESCVRKKLQEITKIDELEKILYKADELIKEEEFIEAIEILKPCLNYFSKNVSPLYSLAQVSQDLFKMALVRLGNEAQGVLNQLKIPYQRNILFHTK